MFFIDAGVTTQLVQNTIYACPTPACVVVSDTVCEFSLVETTTGFTAVALSTTGFTNAYPFVRCTSANAIISFKQL